MVKAVVDTNLLISSLISPFSYPREMEKSWRAGKFILVTSREIEGKAQFIVTGDKALRQLKEYHGIKIVSAEEFIIFLNTMMHEPDSTI